MGKNLNIWKLKGHLKGNLKGKYLQKNQLTDQYYLTKPNWLGAQNIVKLLGFVKNDKYYFTDYWKGVPVYTNVQ